MDKTCPSYLPVYFVLSFLFASGEIISCSRILFILLSFFFVVCTEVYGPCPAVIFVQQLIHDISYAALGRAGWRP